MVDQIKACSCAKCISLCQNPGWFAPDEARRAIAGGFADRMMLDYWITSPQNVYVLAPAAGRCAKDRAPNTEELFGDMPMHMSIFNRPTKGRCTFLNEKNRCELHDSGFKPMQCIAALGCEPGVFLSTEEMGQLWDNPEAQALVREWLRLVGLDDTIFEECT